MTFWDLKPKRFLLAKSNFSCSRAFFRSRDLRSFFSLRSSACNASSWDRTWPTLAHWILPEVCSSLPVPFGNPQGLPAWPEWSVSIPRSALSDIRQSGLSDHLTSFPCNSQPLLCIYCICFLRKSVILFKEALLASNKYLTINSTRVLLSSLIDISSLFIAEYNCLPSLSSFLHINL